LEPERLLARVVGELVLSGCTVRDSMVAICDCGAW